MNRPNDSARASKLTIGVLYGFRALMVLFVCNYHFWQQGWLPQYAYVFGRYVSFDYWTRSSYMFVDGMLLLSGLLLYLPYAREKEEGIPAPGVKRFYFNRASRILPSYLLTVLAALFLIALPQGMYGSPANMWKDIITHLTFTFNFWADTYLRTPLNGALWTVAVEVQFYLIFPLLARATQKRPALTLGLMALAGWAYRLAAYALDGDLALMVNQMPSFMDVYALGMLGAILYVKAHRLFAQGRSGGPEGASGSHEGGNADAQAQGPQASRRLAWLSMPIFVVACVGISQLLQLQSTTSLEGILALRKSQLILRLPFALALLCAMLSAALMPRLLQKLLDNRLMRFLSTISFNLYCWHVLICTQAALHWFPSTLHDDHPLQKAYTAMCFGVSIVVAMAATYGVEQPIGRLLNKWIKIDERRKNDHERPQTDEIEPPAHPVFLRAEERAAGAD